MNKLGGLSKLLSLIIFYFVLIALIIYFAYQVLNTPIADNTLHLTVFGIVTIIIPGMLLINIIIYVVHLARERKANAAGIVFKTKLIHYFLLLVILAVGPQALLSLSFIRVIGDTWFDDSIGDGLQNSLDITVNAQRALSDEFRNFIYSPLFESLAERASDNYDRFFVQLSQIRPSIITVQLFSPEGDIVYFGGDETPGIEYANVLRSPEGMVIRDIRQDRNFIRIYREINDTVIVLMEELPAGFGEQTLQIISALTRFNEYQGIKNILYVGILVFYGILSLPLFFMAILAGFYLSDALIKPITNLETAIRKVTAGDFSFRLLMNSRAELRDLAESFNLMLAELESSRSQLVQSERIAAWKDIAQRLAHEIKNPLTPIRLSIERLDRKHKQEAEDFPRVLESSVNSILREVDHLTALITEFRDFARLPLPQPQSVSLRPIIEDVLNLFQPSPVSIVIDEIDEETLVYVDPAQFRQVFRNLLHNALDAIGGREDGVIRFSTKVLTVAGKQIQRVQIQDNGSGIDQENMALIFNPYHTGKDQGTGLGLAIVQRIIQDHNAKIWVESEPGQGTRFFIDILIVEKT